MANICIYKIKVKGRKLACEALMAMMPLFTADIDIFLEEGTEDDYTIGFSGDCKWSVDSYCSPLVSPGPWDDARIREAMNKPDASDWYYTIQDKSILLDCEIFCNSKDIDSSTWAYYEHYNRGKRIFDECPKELHIKRGRDYDTGGFALGANGLQSISAYNPDQRTCKVKFVDGRSYWYNGNYEVGDLVRVDGAKKDLLGIVVETSTAAEHPVYCEIKRYFHNAELFKEEEFLTKWESFKAKDRRIWLESVGLDPAMTKKKFLSTMESLWLQSALKLTTWDAFKAKYGVSDEE